MYKQYINLQRLKFYLFICLFLFRHNYYFTKSKKHNRIKYSPPLFFFLYPTRPAAVLLHFRPPLSTPLRRCRAAFSLPALIPLRETGPVSFPICIFCPCRSSFVSRLHAFRVLLTNIYFSPTFLSLFLLVSF